MCKGDLPGVEPRSTSACASTGSCGGQSVANVGDDQLALRASSLEGGSLLLPDRGAEGGRANFAAVDRYARSSPLSFPRGDAASAHAWVSRSAHAVMKPQVSVGTVFTELCV